MKNSLFLLLFGLFTLTANAQLNRVSVVNNSGQMKLVVNGSDFMINGMNWDYFPIGTNYTYSLWKQPDDVIKAALDIEMTALKNMGVNAVRQYTGVQPKWIQYIYEKYGIYTMLNHSFGRYGLTIDNGWMANTEYSDPRVRELLLSEVTQMVEEYKGTPGLLMYLLGNENNYGLFWGGAETEDIPIQDRTSTIRARAMYRLMDDAAIAMKNIDGNHPVAMCNGDVLFIELVAEECKNIDIYGTNMYRGISFGDAFQVVKDQLNMPIMFTEFGADAFNELEKEEDQRSQAYYMVGNWQEIYENAAGLGKVGNSLGGFTFQFTDGWWKVGQTKNLDVHDDDATWNGGGYTHDIEEEGADNMNEEWFGICAKGPTNARGLYQIYPRAAYYALRTAHNYDPYKPDASLEEIKSFFSRISLTDAVLRARGDKGALIGYELKKVRLSQLRGEISTFTTGGDKIATPDVSDPTKNQYPDELGFDHMQSFFVGIEASPTSNIRVNTSFNVLGQVAENPINAIFYENRGRPYTVTTTNGQEVV
ncbi:MAG: glycoside hydrolase family 2 TIM barrel-domain containing protein, partial [Bacteroidota bacterium]